MSLARYAASNPAGVVPLLCLELSHSAWAAAERRVMQPDDCTVIIAGVPTLFKGFGSSEAGPWQAPNPTADDTAKAATQLAIDDFEEALYLLIESVRSSDESVACKIYGFLSSAPDVLLYASQMSINGVSTQGGKLMPTASTMDPGNRRCPRILHTLANTPGLRGRK